VVQNGRYSIKTPELPKDFEFNHHSLRMKTCDFASLRARRSPRREIWKRSDILISQEDTRSPYSSLGDEHHDAWMAKTIRRPALRFGPAGGNPGAGRKSFESSRCGDVAVVTKPNYLITAYPTGTSHGTPHAYDTHVPLLVYGLGVQAGERKDAVTPQAVAKILASSLSIQPPKNAEAPVPADLFKSR
jgi:hypothetical protein